MTPHETFWKRAQELTEFCIRRAAAVFAGWPVPTVFAYVFFHLVDRTAFVCREHGEITGVLFMSGRKAADVLGHPEEPFAWKRSQDSGDALLIGPVIGHRGLFHNLRRQVESRWPDWMKRRIFTHRRERLVELPMQTIERLI